MNDREAKVLEQMMDRELKKLPELPAPPTLLHRVMLAVHREAQLPWWKRAWPAWPREVQVVSLLLLLGGAGALVYATVVGLPEMARAVPWQAGQEWLASHLPGLDLLRTLSAAGALVFRSVGQQFLLLGSLLAVGTYLFCVGLTTLGYRLAFSKI